MGEWENQLVITLEQIDSSLIQLARNLERVVTIRCMQKEPSSLYAINTANSVVGSYTWNTCKQHATWYGCERCRLSHCNIYVPTGRVMTQVTINTVMRVSAAFADKAGAEKNMNSTY